MSFFFRSQSKNQDQGRQRLQSEEDFDEEIKNVNKNKNNNKKKKIEPEQTFSIDDAFDIPEDQEMGFFENLDEPQSVAPIIKRGQLRLSFDDDSNNSNINNSKKNSTNGHHQHHQQQQQQHETGSVTDSASLIQSGIDPAQSRGYYEGPPIEKFWWKHPRVRENYKVVVTAFMLCFLGLILVICGIVVFCLPSYMNIQGVVFLVAGLICLVPGAYHIGYGYLAVKGKRGYEFNHLPLFNN